MRYFKYRITDGEIIGEAHYASALAVPKRYDGFAYIQAGELSPETHYVKDGVIKPLPAKPHEVCMWDNATETWQTPVDKLRDHKWEEIKIHRNTTELSGFQYGDHKYDSDTVSQSRITAAATWAMNNAALTLDWITQDNVSVTLTATEIQEMAVALGEHIVACHTKARQIKQQIDAAVTAEEIHQITW